MQLSKKEIRRQRPSNNMTCHHTPMALQCAASTMSASSASALRASASSRRRQRARRHHARHMQLANTDSMTRLFARHLPGVEKIHDEVYIRVSGDGGDFKGQKDSEMVAWEDHVRRQ